MEDKFTLGIDGAEVFSTGGAGTGAGGGWVPVKATGTAEYLYSGRPCFELSRNLPWQQVESNNTQRECGSKPNPKRPISMDANIPVSVSLKIHLDKPRGKSEASGGL